jgi:hypothetical protein
MDSNRESRVMCILHTLAVASHGERNIRSVYYIVYIIIITSALYSYYCYVPYKVASASTLYCLVLTATWL